MDPIRVAVVDDEPIVRRDLVRTLSAEPDVVIVGEARNGLEALDLIDAEHPDLVFLDVQMPELDGLGVVAGLTDRDGPLIVFVTAFDRYAIDAFEAHAVDYLLKPFDPARCRRAMERVRIRRRGLHAEEGSRALAAMTAAAPGRRYLERLLARGTRQGVVVDLAEVRWIEAADNYARLHTGDGAHLTRRTMRELESYLDPERFVRIHRSAMVNVVHVRAVTPLGDGDAAVDLADGTRLTMSRTYRSTLERLLGGLR
jgi:two-component system LytT family response regulator